MPRQGDLGLGGDTIGAVFCYLLSVIRGVMSAIRHSWEQECMIVDRTYRNDLPHGWMHVPDEDIPNDCRRSASPALDRRGWVKFVMEGC